ncbi:MAG: RNA polymerase sigma-70 factor (ECF subfamily) [Cocleimonas sp.]|jgi:RNA polymerase sigma-70 factor (ECF subfamily)
MNNLNTLLAKAAKKDQSAFQALYKDASPKLFALSLRLVNYDKETAEEILQEAFIKIWNKADKFDTDKGSAMSWMSTVVRNQAFDRLRSYKSRPQLVEESDYETLDYTANELQPEQQSFQRQQLAVFKEMLDKLPPKQQECVTQSLVQGYSHSEISERMELPLGTVKAWLRRNLKEFQEGMADRNSFGF